MAQCGELSRELLDVSQMAARLLIAWRSAESAEWVRRLEMARLWAAHTRPSTTLEMERLDVLRGALESLGLGSRPSGAIRLLEHLAGCFPQSTLAQNRPAANGWPLLSGKLAVVPCSQFVH